MFGWGELGGAGGGAVKIILLGLWFATCMNSQAQLVQVGPTDPHFCDKIERIKPNLELAKSMVVRGKIVDQSGALFKNSRVELRIYVSSGQQRLMKAVTTDSNGHFDLGEIEAGRYRLLASSNRVFQQPESIECSEKSLCDIQLVLRVNPTDMPESLCPIK